jgi:hypothetical protein
MNNKFDFENYLKNNPLLKEGEAIISTIDLMARPLFKSDETNITIPKGSEIEILDNPFEKDPNASKIRYNDKEYAVTRSKLDNLIALSKKGIKFKEGDIVKIHGDIAVDVAGGNVKGEIHDGPHEDGTYTVLVGPKRMPKDIDGKFLRPLNKAQ